jgi:hypothetical protein
MSALSHERPLKIYFEEWPREKRSLFYQTGPAREVAYPVNMRYITNTKPMICLYRGATAQPVHIG